MLTLSCITNFNRLYFSAEFHAQRRQNWYGGMGGLHVNMEPRMSLCRIKDQYERLERSFYG